MYNKKIAYVIPARGGSTGIKNKNIIDFCGQPLISYAILDAIRLNGNAFVTSDNNRILKISEKYGAIPVKRPAKYASNTSLDIEWAKHFLSWFEVTYDDTIDYIVHLRATTPIRDISILKQATDTLQSHTNASALRSVELFPESPYKWVKIDSRGYFEPLLNNDKEAHITPRQNYPNVYRPNGYVDIYKTSVIKTGSLCGDKVLAFITPYSPEIDNEETFKVAEAMMKQV